MWEHEKALVRDDSEIDFNLAIGDPVALRNLLCYQHAFPIAKSSGYPKIELSPKLLRAIKEADLPVKKHLVPTHGAKHALHAALYALNTGPVAKIVRFRRPFWVSYPSIAQYAGMDWASSQGAHKTENQIYIHASPNNPDGFIASSPFNEQNIPEGSSVIWDAAYAHRLYGWTHNDFAGHHDISVWSGGKLTGDTGARVGWLSTDNEDLASRARQYVEQTTSGVSPHAMDSVAASLSAISKMPDIVANFRNVILDNESVVGTALGQIDPTFTNMTDVGGMFLWTHVPQYEKLDKALKAAKIAVLRGEACGMNDPGWYRWSLGQSEEFTSKAMNALTKAAKRTVK